MTCRITRAIAISTILLTSCARPTPTQTTLTVFAAASLTAAFREIGTAFEATHSQIKVAFNFAGSQELRTQIEQGARADVFASADTKNMDALSIPKREIFAHNRLVVVVPHTNPANIKELRDLAKLGLKIDTADANVPVGTYTLQMLDKLAADAVYGTDFKNNFLARVVSKENNVKQVVSKVSLGEADAGIVYATDAQAATDKLDMIDISDQFNIIAIYPIAVLPVSTNQTPAQQFVDLVLSSSGQTILQKYGFAPK